MGTSPRLVVAVCLVVTGSAASSAAPIAPQERAARNPPPVVSPAATAAVPSSPDDSDSARVSGIVLDQSGGALAAARVTVRNSGGVLSRTTTGADGSFQLNGIGPGRYEVEVSKDLFETSYASIEVVRGVPTERVRVTLAVSGIRETVMVGAPKVDERPTGQILTSIDRSTIKDVSGFSIAEVIPFSPGVTIQQGNGPRDVLISVRGSNTRTTFGLRNIQVFEDGFNVTQPDGLARTDLVDPHAYGAIDVARGPSSSLYGNYAIEGAINFQTRRPADVGGIELGQDFGSFGYHNTYLTYGHAGGAFEVMAFGSAVGGSGFTAHTAFDTQTANVLATYRPSSKNRFVFKFIDNEMHPDLSIRLSLNQLRQNPYQEGCETAGAAAAGCASVSVFANGVNGPRVSLSAEQAGLRRHDRRTIVGTRWEHLFDDHTTWRTQLVWDVKDITQPTGATSAVGVTPSFNLLSDVTRKGSLGGRAVVHFIGLSANLLDTNSQTFNVAPGGDGTTGALTATTVGRVSNIGMRAREELKLTSRLTASAGVGLERTELSGRNTGYTYPTTASPTTTRTDALRRFTNVAPEATLVVQPSRVVRLQARVGSAYGTPQLGNLFVTSEGVNGNNTQLVPQSNVGIDTGVDVTTRFLTASVAGYYEWYRNELVSQSPGVNLLSYTFNAPRSIHKGFEATGDWQPLGEAAPGLRLRVSYTWMNQVYDEYVERLSAGSFTQAFDRAGNEIPGIAPHSFVARLGYDHLSGRIAGLGGHVEYTYRDAAWLDNANLLQAPGYTLTNINVHYDGRQFRGVLKSVHVLFEVRNVGNKVWVGSAGNLSNSLSPVTGQQNGALVLAGAGSMYAGAPRSIFTGIRVGF